MFCISSCSSEITKILQKFFFGKLLTGIISKYKKMDWILAGDSNTSILSLSNNVLHHKNLVHSFHYVPSILKQSLFSSNVSYEPSVLDPVWINKVMFCEHGTLDIDFTNHCKFFITILMKSDVVFSSL